MKNISVRFLFDRKKEASKTKQGLLQIEVREMGTNKCILISTGIKLYANQFSEKMGFTCKNHDLADALTKQANDLKTKIHAFALSDKCKILKDVRNWKDNAKRDLVIPYIENEMRLRNMKYNTLKGHITLLNKLRDYKVIVSFMDITYSNVVGFDKHMRDKGLSNVSINKNHSLFNMYIKTAINKEYLSKNPYDLFIPPKGKNSDPIFLTLEEVDKIKNLSGLSTKLSKVKDLFIFQCYTGLAYSDMQLFTKVDIQIHDNKEIIRSSRIKTDESFVMLFLPDAKNIAEKYNYDLPKISNQKYNDYLKLLAAHPKVNINKKISSHTARHTFATYLINNGIPLESVSKILGHSNIKQSQHYARILGKKVINDMEKLL